MKKVFKVLSVALLSVVATLAQAGVSLLAGRVGADDVDGTAKFYSLAFGMFEVNRLQLPSGPEIFLNFGESVDAAKANLAAPIAIMHTAPNTPRDSVPHLMLQVTDMNAILTAVRMAGGSVERGPISFGTAGIQLGFVTDPAGNRIELIQPQKP